ncbi:hypothetical protein [Mesonia aquimarina]|uniref:hypothetical protein n=1 Tax=Mesonia aquimarina TaxID=1504967 RepID=UPI0013CF0DC1|nr:hypothetical protein [Mesonia aquimarina]
MISITAAINNPIIAEIPITLSFFVTGFFCLYVFFLFFLLFLLLSLIIFLHFKILKAEESAFTN